MKKLSLFVFGLMLFGFVSMRAFGQNLGNLSNDNILHECFSSDKKQPFQFRVCYVLDKSYRDSVIELVFPTEIPQIADMEFWDITRNLVTVKNPPLLLTNSIPPPGQLASRTFKLASLFSLVNPADPDKGEMKFKVTLWNVNRQQSTVTGVFKFRQ